MRPYRPYLILLLVPLLMLFAVADVQAHANLLHSEPAANTTLDEPPAEIHLAFSEPLERGFSRVELRNTQGEVLPTTVSVAEHDAKMLIARLPALADGTYTVSWQVVSRTDGHMTQGSFPFSVGAPLDAAALDTGTEGMTIPAESAVIRMLNLLGLTYLLGALAFYLFVWRPAANPLLPVVERWLRQFLWAGWLLAGIVSVLLLLLQVHISTGADLTGALQPDTVWRVVDSTRFGDLWIIRMLLWLWFGAFLIFHGDEDNPRWPRPFLLAAGGGILLTQSMFSHASGAPDSTAAIAADWLHLVAMSVWIGGLLPLVMVTRLARTETGLIASIVARFSNLARISVAALVVTGTYAAWLQVGSLDALTGTSYGRALLIKLALFVPLLGLGAFNVLFTQRGLNRGEAIWTTRLRRLTAVEVTLALGIMAAVGVMTAIAPARSTPVAPPTTMVQAQPQPYMDMATADGLMAHLNISPGTVGPNEFSVNLMDAATGQAITDATLIRMRFEHLTENLGESELRPTLGDGINYVASGANLSVPGEWRIRLTIQRPNEFDTVLDFRPEIAPAPAASAHASSTSLSVSALSVSSRQIWLLLTGGLGLVIGLGTLYIWRRAPALDGKIILGVLVIAVSVIICASGLQLYFGEDIESAVTHILPDR